MFEYNVTFSHEKDGEMCKTVDSWIKASDEVQELLFIAKRGAKITIEVM